MFKLNRLYYVLLLISWLVAFVFSANAQSKTFEAIYGTSTDELGNFVQPTADGGYIICGAKGIPGSQGYYDFSLVKIDAYGTVQWTNTIGDSLHNEQAQCIRQTDDGGYIVFGSRSGITSSAAWMVKTDNNGVKTWAAEQQGSNSLRYGYGLITSPDGGFQTASYDNVAANTNYFQLQKTDPVGVLQWGPMNVVSGSGSSSSLALTMDGNYISVGTSAVNHDNVTGNYFSTITLVKMNNAGTQLWSKTYKSNVGHGAFNYLQGFGVQATTDGGYVICGSTTVNSKGGTDIFLLKTNSTGDSLWSRNYGGTASDVASSVKEVPGGGFVITGSTRSFGNGSSDIFILRTTSSGDSIWIRTFGGTNVETAGNIEVAADSGFVIVGTSKSYGNGQNDIIILRTDLNGYIPDATIQTAGTICNEGSVTLTAAPGYSYYWSTNATTQSITVNQPGNYSVTVKDNFNNVKVSQPATIAPSTSITPASMTLNGPPTFCAGGSVVLTTDSAPGYLYQWQVNGYFILGVNSRTYTAREDGDYKVTIRKGCNAMVSPVVHIQVQSLPEAPTITPFGGSLVSSSSDNNQWFLNGNAIQDAVNMVYTPSASGFYSVTVSNESGCSTASEEYPFFVTGMEENNPLTSYSLFPNPAADLVHVNYSLQSSSKNYFVIYTTEGKEVYREQLLNEKGTLSFNAGSLASGLYFSAIEANGNKTGRKVMAVQRP